MRTKRIAILLSLILVLSVLLGCLAGCSTPISQADALKDLQDAIANTKDDGMFYVQVVHYATDNMDKNAFARNTVTRKVAYKYIPEPATDKVPFDMTRARYEDYLQKKSYGATDEVIHMFGNSLKSDVKLKKATEADLKLSSFSITKEPVYNDDGSEKLDDNGDVMYKTVDRIKDNTYEQFSQLEVEAKYDPTTGEMDLAKMPLNHMLPSSIAGSLANISADDIAADTDTAKNTYTRLGVNTIMTLNLKSDSNNIYAGKRITITLTYGKLARIEYDILDETTHVQNKLTIDVNYGSPKINIPSWDKYDANGNLIVKEEKK